MVSMKMPRRYDESELTEISKSLAADFARSRHRSEEQTAAFYHDAFAEASKGVEKVFDGTDDLNRLVEEGKALLVEGYLYVLRNMLRPTVSQDDFASLTGAGKSSPKKFEDDALSSGALSFLSRNLNADLFPWVEGRRRPADTEKHAATVAVAALIAEQKTKTFMRGGASKKQEEIVKQTLVERCGLNKVEGVKSFELLSDGPKAGQLFSKETEVAGTKADVVIGLHDGRIMCLECKVSNSEVNSYKRLNHEAVDKVKKWNEAFGKQCVSGAVLQGCFKASNMTSAQENGAYLFWSADLEPLAEFVNSTKC